ncbi:MAG: hypothetical protein RIS93_849, partial [Actinomycetota bacterium]
FPAASKLIAWDIPASVESIADYAFYGSTIKSLKISKNVSKISDYSFINMSELTDLSVDNSNPNFSAVDGALYNNDKTILLLISANKISENFVIPNGIKKLGPGVFNNLLNTLKTITIPSTLEDFDYRSLSQIKTLTSIKVDSANLAFSSIDGVLFNKEATELYILPGAKLGESYAIPNSVNTISEIMLPQSSSIISISIPESVTSLSPGVFSNAYSLKNIEVDLNNKTYASVEGVLFNKSLTRLISYPASKNISQYVVANGVNIIDRNAFMYNRYLKVVTIPESVEIINSNAFYGLSVLKTISLPNNLLLVDYGAFGQTPALGYKYCGVQYSLLEILDPASGLESKTNVCGKSLPGTVTIGEAKATGTTTATVSFTAPVSDGGSPIISYTAISNIGETTTLNTTATSGVIEITGLSPATSYSFKIIATNLVGDSPTESTMSNTFTTLKLTAKVEDYSKINANYSASKIGVSAPKSDSDGAWSYVSSDPTIVTVNGSNLEIKKGGSVVITALQAETALYESTTKTFTVDIAPISATIGNLAPISALADGKVLNIVPATSNSDGAWTYSLSDPTLGTVNGSTIVFTKAGKTTLVANQAATASFLAGQITTTVEVKPFVQVTSNKRTITVAVKGGKALVKINGKAALVGLNKVTAGKKLVTVTVNGAQVYNKYIVIK